MTFAATSMALNFTPATSPSTDASALLLLAVAAGEKEAFNGIVQRWRLPLIHYFQHSIYSPEDAEELALTTLTKVYRAAPTYSPDRPFSAFLFRVARNTLISHLRKHKSRQQQTISLDDLPPHREPSAPTETTRELNERFTNALQSLPEQQRTALVLRVQQDLSYEDIADILHLSLTATKACIHRARNNIKAQLRSSNE